MVTRKTARENESVAWLVTDDSHWWLTSTDKDIDVTYSWLTGERYVWLNWEAAELYAGTDEDYVEFLGSNSKWNDTTNNDTNITGYNIEYAISDSAPKQNTENGHYYQYVNDPGRTWTDAKTAAESKMFNDFNGHLVTITTAR